MESRYSNSENQNDQKPTRNSFARLGAILNCPLIVLLIGSLIATLGAVKWREEILFNRQVNTLEKINTDIGYYIASANTAIESIKKGTDEQQKNYIENYNQQQMKWFGASLSQRALLVFYFTDEQNISKKFEEIVEATENIDISLQRYSDNKSPENYKVARNATNIIETKLDEFNSRYQELVMQ